MKLKAFKIPKSTADMTMDYLPFYFELAKFKDKKFDDLTPVEISDALAIFFQTEPEHFDRYEPDDNKRLFAEACSSCHNHKPTQIRPEITIGEITYVWAADFSNVNTAFHRALSLADFSNDPARILGFVYIEEGMSYNQLDKSSSIINPHNKRSDDLKKAIKLDEFLTINDFFLLNRKGLATHSRAIKANLVEKNTATQNNGSGRER